MTRGALLGERVANGEWSTKEFIRDLVILSGLFIGLVAIFVILMLLPAMASPMQVLPEPKIAAPKSLADHAGPVKPRASRKTQTISIEVAETGDVKRLTFPSNERINARLVSRGGGRYALQFSRAVTFDVSRVIADGPDSLRDIWIEEGNNGTTVEFRVDRDRAIKSFNFGQHLIVEISSRAQSGSAQAGFVTQKKVAMDLSDIAAEELGDAGVADGDLEDQYRSYLQLH